MHRNFISICPCFSTTLVFNVSVWCSLLDAQRQIGHLLFVLNFRLLDKPSLLACLSKTGTSYCTHCSEYSPSIILMCLHRFQSEYIFCSNGSAQCSTELLPAFCTIDLRFPRFTWKQLDGCILSFHCLFTGTTLMSYINNEIKTSTNLFFLVTPAHYLQARCRNQHYFILPVWGLAFCTISVLFYSSILYLLPHFYFSLRWCLCSFCTVYPLFIIPLCFILSTDFGRTKYRTYILQEKSDFSLIPVISVGSFQIISLHILTHLWIESHYQAMAYLVENGCSTQREHCIEGLH